MDLFALCALLFVLVLLVFGNRVVYLRHRAAAVVEEEHLPPRLRDRALPPPEVLYGAPGEGALWLPVALGLEPVAWTLSVVVVGDPRYRALRVYAFDDERHGQGALLEAERGDGTVLRLRSGGLRDLPVALGGDVGDGIAPEVGDLEAWREASPAGLALGVRGTDPQGVTLEVNLHDPTPGARSAAWLVPPAVRGGPGAPPGPGGPHTGLTLHFAGQGVWLPRRGPTPEIAIGGSRRRAAAFRLPVEGRRAWRAGYDLAPVLARIAAPGGAPRVALGSAIPGAEGGAPFAVDLPADGAPGSAATITLRQGHPELRRLETRWPGSPAHGLRLDLAPALPDLGHLRPGVGRQGRFGIGIDHHGAVLAGAYQAERVGDRIRFRLGHLRGWQPRLAPGWVRSLYYDFSAIAGPAGLSPEPGGWTAHEGGRPW